MDLFFNECSLHGQFPDIATFVNALDALMEMRRTAKKYDRELYCYRNYYQALVTHELTLPQVISRIDKNKARVLMAWFGQTGPYWEDNRSHTQDDYIECQNEIVTDTAIGECAYLQFSNKSAQLASMAPSSWEDVSLKVTLYKNYQESCSESLINHINSTSLDTVLQRSEPPLRSWSDLEDVCRRRFENLTFSDEAFTPLFGSPFSLPAANSMVELLSVLSKFKAAHHIASGRSDVGHSLYRDYFSGGVAWYSDSSDKEKKDFKNEMTFPHPERKGESIFAPFHGKVQTPQMRVHISWPVTADKSLFVLYVGPKITKY